MNPPESRIPEDKTQEVFTLAAQLYAQHSQSYSVEELIDAGTQAKIPPEFIQQAITQMQLEQLPNQQAVAAPSTRRTKLLFASFATALLAFGGMYFLVKNALSSSGETAQVVTVPTSNQPQISDTNREGGNFKCEGQNLEGQDLRSENLQNADCTGAKLAGANLSGVNLESANFSSADLKNANLSGANLSNGNFTEADLASADLSGANLTEANLSKTTLKSANLSNTTLKQTNFAEAKLESAKLDIRYAKQERVNFNNATLPDGKIHP